MKLFFSKEQNTKYRLLNTHSGFSLIELIVSISIIIIISSVALFNQAKFSSDILISNMAYEIALIIRQAQVYGTSSKGNEDALTLQGSEQYRVGYGVHFADDNGEKPGSFLTFVDVPNQGGASSPGENTTFNYQFDIDNTYGPTDVQTLTSLVDLTQGQKIRRFCAYSSTEQKCWDTSYGSNMSLDIVFVKPNPDAHITFWDGSEFTGNIPGGTKYDEAKIVIESGLGDKCRTVRIRASGQVSVDPISNDDSAGCEVDG